MHRRNLVVTSRLEGKTQGVTMEYLADLLHTWPAAQFRTCEIQNPFPHALDVSHGCSQAKTEHERFTKDGPFPKHCLIDLLECSWKHIALPFFFFTGSNLRHGLMATPDFSSSFPSSLKKSPAHEWQSIFSLNYSTRV